jgi:hypothetical protein
MKISQLIIWSLLLYYPATAQYYYNDILLSGENQIHFSRLIKNKIKQVSVKALEEDGTPIEDFYLDQKIDLSKRTLTTYSKTNFSDASILETQFNEAKMPVSVLDSADGASTITHYSYDESGRISTLQSTSVQPEQKENVVTELRSYSYNAMGMPYQMLRIKGGADTMVVKFSMAENGLPGEESWYKSGKKIETWYYYYDENKHLTDIVRYNAVAKKMLPDYLFGYDESNNMSSKVSVQPVTGQFRIWQYKYDARGLKTEEMVMNRQRKPEGKLVYTYE